MSRALDLTGVDAKMQRGFEHLQALDQEFRDWLARQPYGIRHEIQDDGREHTVTLEIYRQTDSPRFGLLIGDCAHNLRSALDHLVVAVARSTLPARNLDRWETRFTFPICTSEKAWRDALAQHRLEGLEAFIGDEINRRQPYHSKDPSQHYLEVLRWLDDQNKHRLLHTVAAWPQPASYEFIPALLPPSSGKVAPPPL